MNQLVIAVLLVATGTTWAMEKKMDGMVEMIAECMKTEKASEADIQNIRKKVLPTTKEGKCMVGCLFEKFGIFEHGKINKEKAAKVCEETFKDNPEMFKKAKATHQICDAAGESAGADKCANGAALLACIVKNMPEFQILPPA